MNNPKLEGSRVVDCVPQTGQCPMGCIECFYNSPDWYADKTVPQIPSADESIGKVVRVNSGHDSNCDRENVIRVASKYRDYFFNTSVPMFDFPGPVVFTVNGRGDDKSWLVKRKDCKRLMFVRFRLNAWNLDEADKVVAHYTKYGVPVVMTFMRYMDKKNIPTCFRIFYVWKHHILSDYWLMLPDKRRDIMKRWADNPLVKQCGTIDSSYCRDCNNCFDLYWSWKREYHEG